MLFTGEYEHTIDAKNRLAIPSDLRTRMDRASLGNTFYVSPGPNASLWIWPQSAFERMAAELEQSLLPAEEILEYEELLFSQSDLVEMDGTGRIRLPERLLTQYGLGPKVRILGVRDHMELRQPDAWDAVRSERLPRQMQMMLKARGAQRPVSGGEEERP